MTKLVAAADPMGARCHPFRAGPVSRAYACLALVGFITVSGVMMPPVRAADSNGVAFTDSHSNWVIMGYDPYGNRTVNLGDGSRFNSEGGSYRSFDACVKGVEKHKADHPRLILYCLPAIVKPLSGAAAR